MSIAVGILSTITGHYRWAIWAGWFLATLGTGLLYLLDVNTTIPQWIFINIVSGLGTGMLFPSLAFGIQAPTPEEDQAPAVALFTFLRTFGQAVGVALGGVIFQNSIQHKIASHPVIAEHASEWAAQSTELVETIKSMAAGAAKDALIQSYSDALKPIWLFTCGLAAVGLISSLFAKEFSLNREHDAKQAFNGGAASVDEEKK